MAVLNTENHILGNASSFGFTLYAGSKPESFIFAQILIQIMTLLNNIPDSETKVEGAANGEVMSIDVSKIQNSVLQRLIQEVKVESRNNISAYNRLHNRHNRSR